MRIALRLDDDAIRDLLAEIEGREERVVDASPVMEALADDFLQLEGEAFRTEGRIFGGWKRNAPWYSEWKRRHGGGRILEMGTPQGGRLRRALTEKGAPWQIRRISSDRVEAGTNLGIAKVLLRGGVVNDVRIPARPFIRLRREDRARWRDHIAGHIAGEASARTLGL